MERIALDLKSLENVGEVTLSPELRAKVLARLNEVRPLIAPSVPFWKRNPLLILGSTGAVLTTAAVLIVMYRPAQQMAQNEYAKTASSAPAAAKPDTDAAPMGAAPPPGAALPAVSAATEKQESANAERDKDGVVTAAGAKGKLADAPIAQDMPAKAPRSEPASKTRARVQSEAAPSTSLSVASPARTAAGAASLDASAGRAAGISENRSNAPLNASLRDTKVQPQFANKIKQVAEGETKNIPIAKDAPAEMAAPPAIPPPAAVSAAPTRNIRAVTRRARADTEEVIRLVIEVDDIKAAGQQIEQLAKDVGGSLTPDTQTEVGERKPYTAQIPAKDVDAFRKSVSQIGKPLPTDADSSKAKTAPAALGGPGGGAGFAGGGGVGGGFGRRGGEPKPDSANKSIRVILVRKPSPPPPPGGTP